MKIGLLDQIITPVGGCTRVPDVPFGVDNGRYGKGWPGYDRWWGALKEIPTEGSLFVVAPDVVGDAEATLKDSLPWLPRIRELGHPAAFAGQDGLELSDVPWEEFDVFFVGGSTEWKLGPDSAVLMKEANRREKSVHMGRVNTKNRIQYAHRMGCDSVDGTLLKFGVDANMPRLLRWMLEVQ